MQFALLDVMLCSKLLNKSVAQQAPIVSKHLDCLLLSPTAPRLLSPSHCTAHVLGHGLWLRKDDTFYAQQIHNCKRLDTLMGASFRVDTCHESTLINISRTRCGQAGKMATALSLSVSINWLKFAVRMD